MESDCTSIRFGHKRREFVKKMNEQLRKKMPLMIAAALSAVTLAGCGYDDSSKDLTKINVDKYVTSIGDYNNLAITTSSRNVITESDVQGYIDYVLEGQSELVKSNKTTVETGDVVNIDYQGLKDGVAFDGGTDEGYDLTIGSGTFIEGFEDGLIGHQVGEEVSLDLTFPENYGAAELAGKAVVFKVKINYISEHKKPELNDETVMGYGIENVSNVEEYRNFVNDSLQESADNDYLSMKRDALQQALVDTCTFADVENLGLYDYYVEQIKKQTQTMADNYGVSVDDVISGMYGMDNAQYEESVGEQAKLLVQGALACAKVAKDQKIKLTDEEFNAQLKTDAEAYGYESAEAFKAAIDADDYRNFILQKKVVDKLLETATVTETEEN